ncbi:MAG: chemotaxis protein CheW [Magnetococcales bacterium]|nr:chemotaxis protein CheW [Magnetococcales bacterium]
MDHSLDQGSHLVFSLTGKLYGVNATLVREIVRLPEITPMEEAPPYIVGVLNLRGQVIPVMDLNIRMGCHTKPYRLTDAILVLDGPDRGLGLVVNEVLEVRVLGEGEVDQAPAFGEFESRRQQKFITGVAIDGEEMVMLLDAARLFRFIPLGGDPGEGGEEESEETELELLAEPRLFNPEATESERGVFRERAKRLMRALDEQVMEGLASLAVVELYGERLGIGLDIVRGFTQLRQVTPIPCCPDHIVGSMNLRGEILTMVEISGFLGIPPLPDSPPAMALVAVVGEITVGVLVHDVVDVIHLSPSEITRAPSAVGTLKKDFLKGAARYEEEMFSLLNLEKVLGSEELSVNETV